MNVMITGAGGFLGQALIRCLSEDDTIMVYAITSKIKQLEYLYTKYNNVKILPKESVYSLNKCFGSEDILINCAFPRGSEGQLFASGMRYLTDTLLSAAKWGVGSIINISSQSVYSQKRIKPADETSALELESGYAVGKYASELLTEAICGEDITFANIRLASLIGPDFDQRVTNKLVAIALRDGKLKIKNGKQQFGFLDIEDAVNGIQRLIKIPKNKWSPVINLGGDDTYSLVEIANTVAYVIEKELNKKITIEVIPDDSEMNSGLDCSLLKAISGYKQQISLEESIYRILKKKLTELPDNEIL